MFKKEEIKKEIKSQYECEKDIAFKLLNSKKEERKKLYSSIYSAFGKKFPDAFFSAIHTQREVNQIKKFIDKESRFLEIGTGLGSFTREISKHVKNVFSIDVVDGTKGSLLNIKNINQSLFSGLEADLPDNYFDVAYSNQVFEHLHPEDADSHLEIVNKALKEGRIYIMITPHRFCGPHDVSKYFDRIASGLHLREYTYQELLKISKDNNYSNCYTYYQRNKYSIKVNKFFVILFEKTISILPHRFRKIISRIFLPSIMVVFIK